MRNYSKPDVYLIYFGEDVITTSSSETDFDHFDHDGKDKTWDLT